MVDALTKWVHSLTAAAPKDAGMRALLRQHDKWLATAKINTPYWGPDAFYQWQGDPHNPVLARHEYVVFTERGRDRLYTAGGADSLSLWSQWQGITSVEPPMPAPPRHFHITGDLKDWAHPERWDIKTG